MGGKALKNIETKRCNQTEYFKIVNEVGINLYSLGLKNSIIPHYKAKEDFGDADFLVETCPNIVEKIKKHFPINDCYNNGNVFSFDYKNFQIDLIFVFPIDFYMSYVYYSYNDLGALIGRMARMLNLVYSPQGLKLKIYSNDYSRKIDTIILSKNPEQIYSVLDLDFKRWQKGFYSLEDIFNFISKSKFFHYNTFDDDKVPYESRKRDNQRRNYRIFKDWIKEHSSLFTTKKFYDLSREESVLFVSKKFPEIDITTKLKNIELKEIKRLKNKEKFNGKILMQEIPKMKTIHDENPEEFGEIIRKFVKTFVDFENFVDNYSKEEIIKHFSYFLEIQEIL